MEKKRVLIAMSGGVDSSAAVLLLQRQGYDCGGAMLQLYTDDVSAAADSARDARQVASALGIPFYLLDEQAAFRQQVMDAFIEAYCRGLTPNPCILCNRYLKFGVLFERARTMGYDYLATGHYARVGFDTATGKYLLLRGMDHRKDQSYVLYQLTQHHLAHLLLPVGETNKTSVRAALEAAALPIARKPDSQDICFIPGGDYVAFLQQSGVKLTPGNFVDAAGNILGQHKGLPCYTLGQGKGLGIALGRHVYVTAKNDADNTVTLGDNADLFSRELTAHSVNWISGEVPAEPFTCTAKTRYSQSEAACLVAPLPGGRMQVVFDTPQRAITPGQAAVLYHGDIVLGGGTIE